MNNIIQSLDAFFSTTAWTMERPPAYGAFHILFVLIGFALSFLIAWKLRTLSDRGKKIVLLTIGIFLFVTEIYRQLLHYFHIGNNSYVWGAFPFQLCDVPTYFCIIAPLLNKGKLQKSLYSFMMYYNLLSGAIAFAEPSGLLHEYWFLTLHSMTWHMLLVFVGLFLCFSNMGGKTKKDYVHATAVLLVLCVFAFCLNLIHRDVSNGALNLFFIGPSNSPIVVFKYISQHFGWYTSTLIYIPALCLGAYLIYLPIHHFSKKKTTI